MGHQSAKTTAFHYTADVIVEAKDGILRATNPDIVVPILELENLKSEVSVNTALYTGN